MLIILLLYIILLSHRNNKQKDRLTTQNEKRGAGQKIPKMGGENKDKNDHLFELCYRRYGGPRSLEEFSCKYLYINYLEFT